MHNMQDVECPSELQDYDILEYHDDTFTGNVNAILSSKCSITSTIVVIISIWGMWEFIDHSMVVYVMIVQCVYLAVMVGSV